MSDTGTSHCLFIKTPFLHQLFTLISPNPSYLRAHPADFTHPEHNILTRRWEHRRGGSAKSLAAVEVKAPTAPVADPAASPWPTHTLLPITRAVCTHRAAVATQLPPQHMAVPPAPCQKEQQQLQWKHTSTSTSIPQGWSPWGCSHEGFPSGHLVRFWLFLSETGPENCPELR